MMVSSLVGVLGALAFIAAAGALLAGRLAWVWLLVLLGGLAAEGVALLVGHGTLSGHIWRLQQTAAGRVLFLTAWAWLTWHFAVEFFNFPRLRPTIRDDILVAALAAALAILARRLKR